MLKNMQSRWKWKYVYGKEKWWICYLSFLFFIFFSIFIFFFHLPMKLLRLHLWASLALRNERQNSQLHAICECDYNRNDSDGDFFHCLKDRTKKERNTQKKIKHIWYKIAKTLNVTKSHIWAAGNFVFTCACFAFRILYFFFLIITICAIRIELRMKHLPQFSKKWKKRRKERTK